MSFGFPWLATKPYLERALGYREMALNLTDETLEFLNFALRTAEAKKTNFLKAELKKRSFGVREDIAAALPDLNQQETSPKVISIVSELDAPSLDLINRERVAQGKEKLHLVEKPKLEVVLFQDSFEPEDAAFAKHLFESMELPIEIINGTTFSRPVNLLPEIKNVNSPLYRAFIKHLRYASEEQSKERDKVILYMEQNPL